MLVEGKIKQPHSTRPAYSNRAASASPTPSLVTIEAQVCAHQPFDSCRINVNERHPPSSFTAYSASRAPAPTHQYLLIRTLLTLIVSSIIIARPQAPPQPTRHHLLIISIITFYYYFRFCLRTLLQTISIQLSPHSRLSCLLSQLFIHNNPLHLINLILARQTSSSLQSPKSSTLLSPKLKTTLTYIALVIMVLIQSVATAHESPSSVTATLPHHSKHSNERLSKDPPVEVDPKLRDVLEMQFLNMMGMNRKPRPANHHKVPDYMLDLYKWFRQGYIANQQERDLLRDDGDEDNFQHKPISSAGAASQVLLALTSEDLSDISTQQPSVDFNEVDEDEMDMINQISQHHRVPRKRRQTQASRVTLQGPANTIISHKLSIDHPTDSKTHRSKRSTSSPNSEDLIKNNEAHLMFDANLPTGEHLKGAELRLYRHSVYDMTSDENRQSRGKSTKPANIAWPLNWSVGYRSDQQGLSSDDITNFTSANSQANNTSSSGDAYSESHSSLPDHDGEYELFMRINIYHLLRPIDEFHNNVDSKTKTPVTKLIDTQVVDVRDSGWLSFDVFPAIDRWVKHPNENFGLLVTFTDYKGRRRSPHQRLVVLDSKVSHVQFNSKPDLDSDVWHEVQPLLITYSNAQHVEKHHLINRAKSNRVKRHHSDDQKDNRSHSGRHSSNHRQSRTKTSKKKKYKNSSKWRRFCTRHPLYFDIIEVGWSDWIVAPPGFQAFYCKGECPHTMPEHLNTTNHAIIQSLVNSVNPAVVPEPCCVPTDLSPITLLYLDQNGKVTLKNYHDMVVEGCGCN